MGFGGGGQGQGSTASSGLACPSSSPPIAQGCGKTCQTSPGARAKWQSPELWQQPEESGTGRTQRGSSQPASPARGLCTAWGQGRCSLLSLLSLECCASGLTRTVPQVPPLLLGQSTFCLAVSLEQETRGLSENETEGREGGKVTEIALRSCGTKKRPLDRKDFVKRLGSCEHVTHGPPECLTFARDSYFSTNPQTTD